MAKKPQEPEKENSERWLLTYADMITLLLALFIVLYAISQIDAGKYSAIKEAMGDAFGTPSSKGGGVSGSQSGSDIGIGDSETDPAFITEQRFKELYDKLAQEIKDRGYDENIIVTRDEDSITLRFRDSVFFLPNSPSMKTDSIENLERMTSIISGLQDSIGHIQIEGHTADQGSGDTEFGWELSALRAIAVERHLAKTGFDPKKVTIVGRSHYDPVADNKSEAGMQQNRRVVLRITKSAVDSNSTISHNSASIESSPSLPEQYE